MEEISSDTSLLEEKLLAHDDDDPGDLGFSAELCESDDASAENPFVVELYASPAIYIYFLERQ